MRRFLSACSSNDLPSSRAFWLALHLWFAEMMLSYPIAFALLSSSSLDCTARMLFCSILI